MNRAGLAGTPAGGSHASRKPPGWWIVVVPCLLTVPEVGINILQGFAISLGNCFDTCNDPYVHRVTTIAEAEFFLGLATVVLLIAGLSKPSWRWVLGASSWTACLLAYLGLLLR